jgi:hypothetical protein
MLGPAVPLQPISGVLGFEQMHLWPLAFGVENSIVALQ